MLIRFWGVRGSLPSAITAEEVEKKIQKVLSLASPNDILTEESIANFISTLPFSLRGTYGGNTTCLEIRDQNNDIFTIDAGSGIRRLGNALMEEERMKGKADLNMFFTHSHWDHIQGLVFFVPFFVPGNKVTIHSSFEDIEERLRYQQKKTHFPITFDEFSANIRFNYFREGDPIKVKGLEVTTKSVRHPGGNYTFKFKEKINNEEKTFIFCSDAEFNLETLENIVQYTDFFRDADVLVFDTQYTFEESLRKIDWGHSSASIAADIAIKSNVKVLVLFHHDPSHDDEKMDDVTLQAIKYKNLLAHNQNLEIKTAYEGLELHF